MNIYDYVILKYVFKADIKKWNSFYYFIEFKVTSVCLIYI